MHICVHANVANTHCPAITRSSNETSLKSICEWSNHFCGRTTKQTKKAHTIAYKLENELRVDAIKNAIICSDRMLNATDN